MCNVYPHIMNVYVVLKQNSKINTYKGKRKEKNQKKKCELRKIIVRVCWVILIYVPTLQTVINRYTKSPRLLWWHHHVCYNNIPFYSTPWPTDIPSFYEMKEEQFDYREHWRDHYITTIISDCWLKASLSYNPDTKYWLYTTSLWLSLVADDKQHFSTVPYLNEWLSAHCSFGFIFMILRRGKQHDLSCYIITLLKV